MKLRLPGFMHDIVRQKMVDAVILKMHLLSKQYTQHNGASQLRSLLDFKPKNFRESDEDLIRDGDNNSSEKMPLSQVQI